MCIIGYCIPVKQLSYEKSVRSQKAKVKKDVKSKVVGKKWLWQ